MTLNEEAVQAGLIKWKDGGHKVFPPTWGVLVGAMEYAGVDQQYIASLKTNLVNRRGEMRALLLGEFLIR